MFADHVRNACLPVFVLLLVALAYIATSTGDPACDAALDSGSQVGIAQNCHNLNH